MTIHDPRKDPEIGDEIARHIRQALYGLILRKVTRAHGGFVFFEQDNGADIRRRIVTLEQWRQWALDAEVVDIAGEDLPACPTSARPERSEDARGSKP